MMRMSLLLAFVSIFMVASVALAATGGKAPTTTLVQSIKRTNHAPTFRYALDISVVRPGAPELTLHVNGIRGRGSLFVHVRAMADAIVAQQQSALLDGPFLYEGAPNGVAIAGKVRWVRMPVARIGRDARPIQTMHTLSPAPLLRVLDEWSHGKTRSPNGAYHGVVAFDDPIVQTALAGMAGGTQFRDVHFFARVGIDGYVHAIRLTGHTADGTRRLSVNAQLYAFGRPVTPQIPREGTFMDEKTVGLAE